MSLQVPGWWFRQSAIIHKYTQRWFLSSISVNNDFCQTLLEKISNINSKTYFECILSWFLFLYVKIKFIIKLLTSTYKAVMYD